VKLIIASHLVCYRWRSKTRSFLRKVFKQVYRELSILKSTQISLKELNLLISGEMLYLLSVSCIQLCLNEESTVLLDSLYPTNSTTVIWSLLCFSLRSIWTTASRTRSKNHGKLSAT
jgi:hypothetical protein